MEVLTIEIVSPRNPEVRWRINAADFDPSLHTRWEDREKQRRAEVPRVAEPKARAGR